MSAIELEDFEMRLCGYVGRARFEDAAANNRREGIGPSQYEHTPRLHVTGAQCEFACSIIVNRYWRPNIGNVGKRRQPDVGGCLEVRSTDLPHGRLIIKPGDDEWPFALILQSGNRHTFLGWAMASRVKQEPLQTLPGCDPAHYMAQARLGSLSELLRYLHENHPVAEA